MSVSNQKSEQIKICFLSCGWISGRVKIMPDMIETDIRVIFETISFKS